jgi:hypothetical protein
MSQRLGNHCATEIALGNDRVTMPVIECEHRALSPIGRRHASAVIGQHIGFSVQPLACNDDAYLV